MPGQLDRRLAGQRAGPPVADVQIDEHVEIDLRRFGGLREQLHLPRAAHREHDLAAAAGDRHDAGDLARIDDGRREQDAGDAGRRQRLGLRHRRGADAARPGCNLPFGNLRALVRLGVRPEGDLGLFAVVGHLLDVGLERRQIDDSAGVGMLAFVKPATSSAAAAATLGVT